MKQALLILIAVFQIQSAFAGEIKVSVKGMVCAFCAQGITKKLKARDEVDTVDVSLEKKNVSVKTKTGKDISDSDLQKILTESGYTVEKIERN